MNPLTQGTPIPAMVQQVYSQEEVNKLVEQARKEGENAGYHRGWQEQEDRYNPPPPPPICPVCGSECDVEHTPFEQEYAGACFTPAQDWAQCKNEECSHSWKLCDYNCDHMVRENTRGW